MIKNDKPTEPGLYTQSELDSRVLEAKKETLKEVEKQVAMAYHINLGGEFNEEYISENDIVDKLSKLLTDK